MLLNWRCSRRDFDLIVEVAERAYILNRRLGSPLLAERRDFIMDIQACHCNGCRLELEFMLTMPDEDFSHDVYGIIRHIDRETGKLGGCFSPRAAACWHSERASA